MISSLAAREILNSRGNPALEVEMQTVNPVARTLASVPSGASCGINEAVELLDGDKNRYGGLGLQKVLYKALNVVFPAIKGLEVSNQTGIDNLLNELDGTHNKGNLGANLTLAVSMAAAKAAAFISSRPLHQHIKDSFGFPDYAGHMPKPFINIINGGIHADNTLDIQEFMIVPSNPVVNFRKVMQYASEVIQKLKINLKKLKLSCNVGDEGGFAPEISDPKDAISIIMQAIQDSGHLGFFSLALDVAASQLYTKGVYHLAGKTLKKTELIYYYQRLAEQFPIVSIEDGLSETDHEGWQLLTEALGSKLSLVADDLFTTNKKLLLEGIKKKMGNAILVKPNQIGTLTETIETIRLAHENGYKAVISHRSGETEDTSIAHLSVAVSSYGLKSGSLARSERLAKYNEVMRIEEYITQTLPPIG